MADNSGKLYFQVAIEDVKKRLDEQKQIIKEWTRANPVELQVKVKSSMSELANLKSKLKQLGVVFGTSGNQIVQIGREIDDVMSRATRSTGKLTTATREMAEAAYVMNKIRGESLDLVNKRDHVLNRIAANEKNILEYNKRISDLSIQYIDHGGNQVPVINTYKKQVETWTQQNKQYTEEVDKLDKKLRELGKTYQTYGKSFENLSMLTERNTQQQRYNAILADTDKLLQRINNAITSGGNRNILDIAARDLNAFQDKAAGLAKFKDDPIIVANLSAEYTRLAKIYGAVTVEQEKMVKASDAALAKEEKNIQAEIAARQRATQAIRTQAEALVSARRETLRSQATDLGKLLTLGEKGLGVEQYNHVRDALRAIRQELREIDTIMQRGGRNTGLLLTLGGNSRDYSHIINTAQQYANIRVQGEQETANAVHHTNSALSQQSQVLSDLKTMAQQYVSIWAAQSFINNIIEQGGQLEQQRLSIQAILGDAAQARELFGQIKALAPESPFGIIDLDKMSKQLTAYGFQYHELFDWTKRLADISAATGTEVSRLALALGHVRSEGALSGYTLRQFSMGNIPLLEKLSQKLGVTKKEIREMVKKKEIGFEDVVEVLKELTDEGGMFYKAQETMAEALNAKYKNLRDTFAIMYGEMAEGAVGDVLKNIAETLTTLSRNWKVLLPMLTAGATAWGVQKMATMALNHELMMQEKYIGRNAIATSKYSMSQLRAIATTGRWTLALRGLGRAMMSVGKYIFNPVTLGFAAVEGLIYLWQKHNQEMEKAEELTKQYALTGKEGARNLKAQIESVEPFSENMSDSKLKQGIDQMTESLKNYGVNKSEIFKTAFGTDEETGKVKTLAEQYQYLSEQMEHTRKVYEEMKRTAGAFEFGIKHSDGGWFDEDVETDLTDYANKMKEFYDKVTEYSIKYGDTIEKAVNAAVKADPAFAEATKNMDSYIQKLATFWENPDKYAAAIEKMNTMFLGANPDDANEVNNSFFGYLNAKKEAMKELDSFFEGTEKKLKDQGYKFNNLTEVQIDNLLKQCRDWIDKHPEWENIHRDIEDKINSKWPAIKFSIEPDNEDIQENLQDWQVQMKKWLDAHKLKVDIKPTTTREEIVKMVHDTMKDAQTAIDQTKPILLRFKADLSDLNNLPAGLQTPWGRKQAKDYQTESKNYKTGKEFLEEFGLPQPKAKGGSGKKEDKQLKQWREQLKELQAFWTEYEKLYKRMSSSEAIEKIRKNGVFPSLFDKNGNLLIDVREGLGKALNDLLAKTDDKTSERRTFQVDIKKLRFNVEQKAVEEALSKTLSDMQEYISKQTERYSLYKSLFDKTGSKDFALTAFYDGRIWDTLSTEFADELRTAVEDAGQDIDIEKLWDVSDSQAKEMLKNVSGGYELWKKVVDLTSGKYKESLEDAAEALKNSMTYEERIAAIREKYKNKAELGESDAQIYARNKAENAEIAQVELERLKDEINWDAVFGNLKVYSKKVLVDVRKNLRDFIKLNRNNMDVQQIKEIEAAISNLDETIADKSGLFGGLQESMDAYRKAVEELTDAEKEYQETVKTYGANSIQAQDALKRRNQAQSNVNNVSANLQQSGDTTMEKLTKVSSALVNIGKKENASLSEVGSAIGTVVSALSSSNTAIGNLIAAIFAVLDALGSDPQGFAENIFKNVGKGVYGLNSLLNINNNLNKTIDRWAGDDYPVRKFMIGVESLDWMKGPDDSSYQEALARYKDLIDVWDKLIDQKRTYLEESWGSEGLQAGKEMLNLLENMSKAEKELAKERLSAGSSFWSHSMGYRMWEGSYSFDGKNWEDVAGEISSKLGVRFSEMADMTNMTSEQLKWIRENYAGLWSKMDTNFREHLENIMQYGDQAKDTIEKIQEKLTGWNLENVKSEWADLMASMDNSSDKLAESLEDKLRNAILNSLVDNLFTKKLQALIDSASINDLYVNSNGQIATHHRDENGNVTDTDVASELTREEYEMLMNQAKLLSDEAIAQRDMLKEMYGWTDEGKNSNSIGSGIKSITEQTADLLSSHTNSIRADVSVNRNMIAQYFPMYYSALTSGNLSLTNIENHTSAIMRSNDAIERSNQAILDRIDGLKNKAWKVPMA